MIFFLASYYIISLILFFLYGLYFSKIIYTVTFYDDYFTIKKLFKNSEKCYYNGIQVAYKSKIIVFDDLKIVLILKNDKKIIVEQNSRKVIDELMKFLITKNVNVLDKEKYTPFDI